MDINILKLFDRISPLRSTNWLSWRFKFEIALKQVGLWKLVQNDPFEKSIIPDRSLINSEQKARTLIGLWVDDSLIWLIQNCQTAHQMWKVLNEHFGYEIKINQNEIQYQNDIPTNSAKPVNNVEIKKSNLDIDKPVILKSTIPDFEIPIEDPTEPNFYGKDFYLYVILRSFPMELFQRAQRVQFNHCGALGAIACKDATYLYSMPFNSKEKIIKIELVHLRGKNVKTFLFGNGFYVALTDNGEVFVDKAVILFTSDEYQKEKPPKLTNVEKICCGLKNIIALDCDGNVWTMVHSYIESNSFKQIDGQTYFNGQRVKDVACTQDGFTCLSNDDRVYFWGEMIDCHSITPVYIKFKSHDLPLKSITGSKNMFIILTNSGKVHFVYPMKKPSKFEVNLISDLDETIQQCIKCSVFEDIFLMVGQSGSIYIWEPSWERTKRSITNSIPDSVNLYTKVYNSFHQWMLLPNNIQTIMENLSPNFQNPIFFESGAASVLNMEQKILISRIQHIKETERLQLQAKLFSLPYYICYQIVRFLETDQTLINKNIIDQAAKAYQDYQEAKSRSCGS